MITDHLSDEATGPQVPITYSSEVMAQSQHSILRYYHHPVLNISTFNCSQCTNNNLFLRPPPSHLNIQFWASQSNYRGGGINWRTAHFPKSRKFPKITLYTIHSRIFWMLYAFMKLWDIVIELFHKHGLHICCIRVFAFEWNSIWNMIFRNAQYMRCFQKPHFFPPTREANNSENHITISISI